MAFLIITRQREGGVYNSVLGTSKHVVVCATAIRAGTMIDFLNEFYADPKMQVKYVICSLNPFFPYFIIYTLCHHM